MTTLIFLASLLAQDVAPPIPTGTSAEFQATAYRVETALGEGKFDLAKALIGRLPSTKVTYSWDDTLVPVSFKGAYLAARDAAFADWSRMVPEVTFEKSDRPLIKFSFQQSLPVPPDGVLPAGAAHFYSDDASEPRVECVIALKRDNPPVSTIPRSVQNEVGFAVGSFLGLAKMPRPIGYMGRSDGTVELQMRVIPSDVKMARKTLEFVGTLRDAAEKKTRLAPSRPEAYITPTALKSEPVSQGTPMEFTLEVTNKGNAVMELRAVPDCGCIHISCPVTVQPGLTGLIRVLVDTSAVWGPFHKRFNIYTNDPDQSYRTIEIVSKVVPAYRLLSSSRSNVVLVEDDGGRADLYLSVNPKAPFKVTGVVVNGVKAVADFEPWSGKMADPDMGEDAIDRQGYKISLLASPTQRQGRVPMTLVISTDSPTLKTLTEPLYAQWGIVAMPERMYFGEVSGKDVVGQVFLTRPGKPFKVTGLSSDSPYLTVKAEPFRTNEVRVSAVLSATAPAGAFSAKIIVKTDDPKKPTVEIPVTAVMK